MLYSREICDIRSIYVHTVCIYTFKKDHLKIYVNNQYTTRCVSNKHIKVPFSFKNINQRFVNYLAPKYYNLLPTQVKLIKNFKKFSASCKTYIAEHYYEFMAVLKS